MDASPVKIFEYFNGEKQNLIPLFQRPYSWKAKDWDTLWDDLMLQYDPDERSAHFMGAVVSVPAVSKPVGVTKHLVIDGQQRLTTLSLLLAAIKTQCFESGDSKTVNKINGYLTNPFEEEPDDLKLVPTQVDREAFKAVVFDKDLEEFGESRVVQAYQYFLRKLEGDDENGDSIQAKCILDTICQSLQVVMINLGEHDDPYLIFESLNHKGEPLTQSDLVRNYILMRFKHSTSSGGEQEEVYTDLWRPMEDSLGEHMSEFMRHYLMLTGKNVRKNEIYSATKSTFQKLESTGAIREALKEMKRSAFSYRKFIYPDEVGNTRVRSKLLALKDLDTTVFYPLILRLYRSMELELIETDELVACLSMIESFYLRRSVCGVPTNALNKICLETCAQFPEQNIRHWLNEKLSSGSSGRRWPSDEEFKDSLVKDRVYQRKKIVRFLLIQLEEAQEHKEPVSSVNATIEHIMPQTLTTEWKSMLGDSPEETYERWLDTVGNLTLTAYNSELGNLPFSDKKSKLQNSHFEITRWILDLESWGGAEIQQRAEWLADTAVLRWAR